MTITTFPSFSKLELAHRKEVERITSRFEPYSDFNFTSLFCWNTDNLAEISLLNDNLVIKLPDYLDGSSVCSILGENEINASIDELLGTVDALKLVPEVVVNKLKNNYIKVTGDRDNFDYIYSLSEHAALAGKKFRQKRKKTNRFIKTHADRFFIETTDVVDEPVRHTLKEIFMKWRKAKSVNNSDTAQELKAFTRLLDNAHAFNLSVLMVTVDGEPAGFSIHEILSDEFSISHFHKTNPKYANLDVFLSTQAAKDLVRHGCLYNNWEQDLGLVGLRKSKVSYKPIRFLKKYTLSSTN